MFLVKLQSFLDLQQELRPAAPLQCILALSRLRCDKTNL